MATLQKYKQVLGIVQDACKQLDLAVPNGVYNVQDGHSIVMGSSLNLAGTLINSAYCWQQMKRTFTCLGDGVRTHFDLPANLDRFTDNTGWSSAIRRPVVVLDDQQWAEIASWLSQSFYVNPACRIIADQVEFMSPPASGDRVTFQYQMATWVIDGNDNSILKIEATDNSDIPMFDATLMVLAVKIKWREIKGFDTAAVQSDFQDRLFQLTNNNSFAPILTLSGPMPGGFRFLNGYNAPDTNYGV